MIFLLKIHVSVCMRRLFQQILDFSRHLTALLLLILTVGQVFVPC